MRILIITFLYPDDSPVMRSNAVHDLARFWTDEHEVVCFKDDSNMFTLKESLFGQLKRAFTCHSSRRDNVDIHRFDFFFLGEFKPKFIRTILNNVLGRIHEKMAACRMRKKLAQLQYSPDIVIVHIPTQVIVNYIGKLKLDCPKIAVMHITDVRRFETDRQKRKSLYEKKIRLTNSEFGAVYARSHAIYHKLREMGRFDNLQSDIISSGVPQCENYQEKIWTDWEYRKKNILYAGSLIPRKGADVVLRSLDQLKADSECSCIIVGGGQERGSLEQLCEQLSLEDMVTMTGEVSREEVYRYMAETDIFVMPSANETLGLVYLEAMANGCITIASRNEGMDGIIVDGENGYLVNALDIQDLTRCLRHIFGMRGEELQQVSRNAKLTADQYTQEGRAQIYLDQVVTWTNCHRIDT